MKTRFLAAAVLLGALAVSGRAADAADESLQKGLLEEEANRDLVAAIQAYQAAIDQFDEQRKVAGTAVFRLAECYRKLGKTNEAAVQYQRVVRDFADQTNLVTLSRKELDRMPQFRQRLQQIVNRAEPDPNEARDRQRDLLKQELNLVEQQLAIKQEQRNRGVASSEDVIAAEREVLSIKRQLVALDAAVRPDLLTVPNIEDRAPAEPLATDEETQEIQRLKALKANSPDLLNAKNAQGMAPLHYAAVKGQLRVAGFLLGAGADREVRRGDGCTPLHLAVLAGHKAVAEFLLSQGAHVGAPNDNQATPLHIAAAKAFTSLAELLLDKGAEVNAQADSSLIECTVGESKMAISVAPGTPLHSAVESGTKAMVELLLAHKADVEAESPSGNTPLMVAASDGRADTVAALLDAGANVNATGEHGASVLHWAVGGRSAEVVNLVLAHKPKTDSAMDPGLTPLHLAVFLGESQVIAPLVSAGADPNQVMELPGTRYAGQFMIEVPGPRAKFLRLSAPEAGTWTPLEYASGHYGKVLVASLLKCGANPNVGARGAPVVLDAVREPDILKLLLDYRADVNVVDSSGRTPLHVAVGREIPQSVKLLLAAGAKVDAKDKTRGDTPLHTAARFASRATVELLLAAGADVSAKNNDGRTPLDIVGAGEPGAAFPAIPTRPITPGASPANEVRELLQKAGEKTPRAQ